LQLAAEGEKLPSFGSRALDTYILPVANLDWMTLSYVNDP
jgi:hypothetical protein